MDELPDPEANLLMTDLWSDYKRSGYDEYPEHLVCLTNLSPCLFKLQYNIQQMRSISVTFSYQEHPVQRTEASGLSVLTQTRNHQ